MEEWVILSHPPILLLCGGAVLLVLFDRIYRATKGIFTYFSAILAILATALDLIVGASLWEGVTLLLIFLLLNMGVRE